MPLQRLLEEVRPLPGGRVVVFYSFGDGAEGGEFYDSFTLADAAHSPGK